MRFHCAIRMVRAMDLACLLSLVSALLAFGCRDGPPSPLDRPQPTGENDARPPDSAPNPLATVFELEAESGTLSAPMAIQIQADASGQMYVATDTFSQGAVSFAIDVPEADIYLIWVRVLAPTTGEDSFFVSIDGVEEDVYDAAVNNWKDQWQWELVNGRGGTDQPLTLDPRIFSFTSGPHTVTFRGREAMTGLDKILVTNDLTLTPN